MAAGAALLPSTRGGVGLADWDSQEAGLQAMWVLRYLDARRSRWKEVLDYWWRGRARGRGAVAAFSAKYMRGRLPQQLEFWREAVTKFKELSREKAQLD